MGHATRAMTKQTRKERHISKYTAKKEREQSLPHFRNNFQTKPERLQLVKLTEEHDKIKGLKYIYPLPKTKDELEGILKKHSHE